MPTAAIRPGDLSPYEMEKAEVFSSVYSSAEQLGVIHCKKFNPLRIDEVLDDDDQLRLILDTGGA